MKRFFITSIILSIFIFSCTKDEEIDENNINNIPANEYFIEGKVDGVLIRAEYVCPYPGCDIGAGNYDDFLGWVTMQRTVSESDPIGWDILILHVNLDNWVIPDTLDASSFFNQENLQLSYYSGPWESQNNYLVDGAVLDNDSFQMIVTSKSGDIIEGIFSGELRNGSDTELRVTVTEGKFKIKITRM